ncbi:MAG: hypothetical protein IJ003_05995 [Candidatus Gastranaerophilales bacterium]|nr:hypothetical protein [Candidatus Gastranaerophilales bacterium]
MCNAAINLTDIVSGTLNVAKMTSSIQNDNQQLKYQTQIAINNAKQAQNEALRQKQIGIDEARLEKIKGMQKLNSQIAKNSANGFDAYSQTNIENYSDIYSDTLNSANAVKNNYDNSAIDYFQTANEYLNQAKQTKKQYNSNLFKKGMTYLGQFNKVADSWLEK